MTRFANADPRHRAAALAVGALALVFLATVLTITIALWPGSAVWTPIWTPRASPHGSGTIGAIPNSAGGWGSARAHRACFS